MAEQNKPYQPKSLADYRRLTERFEKVNDGYILPEVNVILRLDAGRLGRDWDDYPKGVYPFDQRFVDALLVTARGLMTVGVRVQFAFVHGDEISVLLEPTEAGGLRRRAKLISLLSSAAGVLFYKAFRRAAVFEVKLSELPRMEHVLDYFFWQRQVAVRNYLHRICAVSLAEQNVPAEEIGRKFSNVDFPTLCAIAAELGHDVASSPPAFRFGASCWWEKVDGSERSSGEEPPYRIVQTKRLPEDDERYEKFLLERFSGPSYSPTEVGGGGPWRSLDKRRRGKKRRKDPEQKPD